MIRDLFQTVLTGAAAVTLTGSLGPLASLVSIPDPKNADPLLRFYCRAMLASAGVHHRAIGLENIPGGNVVFVCNHQSHFDPLVLFAHLPRHTRFVAKAELFKIPVFGQAIKATGNLKVDRTGSDADRQVLSDAVAAVRERVSVVFFPEGTRAADGVLQPFKKGAFVLAINAQVPVVPMAVSGTKEILQKGTLRIHGGQRATLVVGEQIPTAGLTLGNREELMEKSRAAVAKLLEQANREVEEEAAHG